MYIPSLLVSMLTFLSPDFVGAAPFSIKDQPPRCHFIGVVLLYLMFASVGIQVLFLFYMNFRLSLIREAFNEYKETMFALIVGTVCFIVDVAVLMTNYTSHPAGFWIIWVCNIVSTNVLIWSVLLKPLYGFIFRREAYLNDWKEVKFRFDIRV